MNEELDYGSGGLGRTLRFMRIDPSALRMMRAIADAGSISGAAEAMGTSQPAISQQVRRLEDKLGTSVLERVGRGVRLTDAGRVLAKHGVAVAAAVVAAQEELESLAGLATGRIRLTAFPSVSASLVPRALATLRRQHPGISMSFTEAEPPTALQLLREGRTDIAITFRFSSAEYGQVLDEDETRTFVFEPLLDEPMWLVFPDDHPIAQREDPTKPVHLSEVSDDLWIAGCEKCRRHLLGFCRSAGFEPQIAFATDDYSAVLGMVAAGLGISLVPSMVLDSAHTSGVTVVAAQPHILRHVELASSPDIARVMAIQAAMKAIRETAAAVASSSPRGLINAVGRVVS